MIWIALLPVQAPAALTLAQVRQLAPAVAGDLILRDVPHDPVETFEVPTGGMGPPGMIEAQLTERPTVTAAGCVRKRWTVRFTAVSGTDIELATVSGVYAQQEIALLADSKCPSTHYVHLGRKLSLADGWKALTDLKKVSDPASRTKFTCTDATKSGLCRGPKTISHALAKLSPWAIVRKGDDLLIWLGERGQIVTEVRFSPANASRVMIDRRIPAPF